MEILIRESSFGRCLNYLSNGRYFPYPEPDLRQWEKYSTSNMSNNSSELETNEGQIFDFSGPEDPDCPKNWPRSVKSIVMLDIMFLNFSFYAASAIFTPSIPRIEEDFNATTAVGTLGLSLFVMAYGIGPLILSPLSHLASIGRTPVYLLGSLAFCLFNIGTALANNMWTILILRFLSGFIGSAPISVGGATLMEVYGPNEVPYAIALYAVSGVCGPILGPVCFQSQCGFAMTFLAFLCMDANMRTDSWHTRSSSYFFFLPETLSTNILLRRARRIRAKTGNIWPQTQSEMIISKASFLATILKQTLDDFKLSCMDPVIVFVNIHTMLIYGILYLWFEFFPFGTNFLRALRKFTILTNPSVFDGIYQFNAIQQALAFFGILVGAIVSVIFYVLWLYFFYQPKSRDSNVILEPEARLVPGQIGAVCIPVCLFIFAWSSRASVPWIVPIIGTAFFAPGFYLTFQSTLNYLGESYPRHAASVFAGNTFFRSFFGGALPLAAPRMLESLGIGWASSILGFISVAMVPLPFILKRTALLEPVRKLGKLALLI
ncbi:hypothetical protein N7450_005569 [Penicillium hetheringtonii]|uniref:Major facilitator superfamily (MFS) profile domain-containing protein n=1 Tax=Penicillium hetheringtonii TaxID=911720 RepID=A0AAD6DJB7_9EURO|nr:hypothetical protein N7450_005569 [Penicillium hetheringtonii]